MLLIQSTIYIKNTLLLDRKKEHILVKIFDDAVKYFLKKRTNKNKKEKKTFTVYFFMTMAFLPTFLYLTSSFFNVLLIREERKLPVLPAFELFCKAFNIFSF